MRYFLAAVAALLLVTTASAEGSYVSVYGGANWDDVINAPGVSDNAGYVVGGTVGTSVKSVPGLRIEADLSFRRNDIDLDVCVPLKVAHETTAVLVNAVYELPLKVGPVQPVALVGIGLGHSEATLESISLARVENTGFAFQLGAGLETSLTDDIKLGVGYRFLKTEPLEVFGQELSDGSNHSVVASLRFAL